MDGHRPPLVHYPTSEHSSNAEAGPSNQHELKPVFPLPPGLLFQCCHLTGADTEFIFLSCLSGPQRRKPLFDSTQDLISRFQLLPAYDEYVRPNIRVPLDGEPLAKSTPGSVATPAPFQAPTPGTLDKGKGKEVLVEAPIAATTPGGPDAADADGDDEDGKGDKKKKNSYKQLIKSVPGKHSMKKDQYLQTIMQVPPKQKMNITKFDVRTQREAFSVSLEGLKGWNINALVAESAQAREDRKKRKELKKNAKAQIASAMSNTSPTSSNFPSAPPSAVSPSLSSAPNSHAPPGSIPRQPQTPSSVGTPRAAPAPPQRLGSRPPGPGPGQGPQQGSQQQHRQGTPVRVGTPRPAPAPPSVPLPLSSSGVATTAVTDPRKRKHDEIGSGAGGTGVNVNGANNPSLQAQKRPTVTTNVSGVGIKPGIGQRPMKKPKISNGHPPICLNGHPQQQPTPQGV
ncbi:hypothetical protein BD410DRAFT_609060 [Rickenella mellea]|uniref:Mediator of RNA polymerase II transcription subunit 19 n=1 Tax=Rickenella mellea TaxID=50990 RepID=A0A4Y7QEJ2_9AGAM|nr:hypothetical protein BD410DRAFT_609060 [Rickenella mellea]